MKKIITAIFIASLVACGEQPLPPKPTKAPEPLAKKAPAPPPPPPVEKPKPPPPPPDEKPKPPPAAVPKVLLDPTLPEWTGQAPPQYKVKFSTSKGDFTVQVTREWAPQGADRFYALVKNGFYDEVRF